MTIKVEQQVLLRVLESRFPSHDDSLEGSSSVPVDDDDEFLLVDFRRGATSAAGTPPCRSATSLPSVGKIRTDVYKKIYQDDDEEDEDASIFTLSTASLSDDSSAASSSGEIERRVSFAEDLVTDEWTRPFTPKDLIPTLFYSMEETSRFRQEYRLERKLQGDSSLEADDDNNRFCDSDDSLEDCSSSNSNTAGYCVPIPTAHRHRISRVVVLHNDQLETFFNDCHHNNHNSQESDSSSQPTPALSPSFLNQSPSTSADNASSSTSFFDNDSFWSGSITWY